MIVIVLLLLLIYIKESLTGIGKILDKDINIDIREVIIDIDNICGYERYKK